MEITQGLMPGQVLQRNEKNKAYAVIVGSCESEGNVELSVSKKGKTLKKHGWTVVGDAKANTFIAELQDLKVGGPYSVKLRIRCEGKTVEKAAVDDIYVGDVWILAGQSNMEGVGHLADAPKPNEKVRAFYMRDEWAVAQGKLHFLSEAVDTVHNGYGDGPDRPSKEELDCTLGNQIKGVGPGNVFGLEMYRRSKVPQGLIACAHGGTSMNQWSPELKKKGGASLYGAMMRRYDKLGQSVAGILWYQGESDADPDAVKVYTSKMKKLVAATRKDMGLPKLPWFVVQLGCHSCPTGWDEWNSIQEQQRLLPEKIEFLDIAPAIDLTLDDGIHISGKGQITLGKRLARLADRMVYGNKKAKPGIALKSITMIKEPRGNPQAQCTALEVAYSNVAKSLTSEGRPNGFALLNDAGDDMCGIFKTELKGTSVILYTNYPQHRLEMLSLSYGYGRIPYCNIVDAENMSIPVMKSVAVNPDHMPFLSKWKTARLADVSSLTRVGFAKADGAKGWKKAPARAEFGVLPKPPEDPTTGVFALRTTVTAAEAMEAVLEFGSNVAFKVWLNGKSVISDLNACAPLNLQQYKVKAKLKAGKNDILVAVATINPGRHFGIAARLGSGDAKVDPRLKF